MSGTPRGRGERGTNRQVPQPPSARFLPLAQASPPVFPLSLSSSPLPESEIPSHAHAFQTLYRTNLPRFWASPTSPLREVHEPSWLQALLMMVTEHWASSGLMKIT